jgi:acid phosphatase type 7
MISRHRRGLSSIARAGLCLPAALLCACSLFAHHAPPPAPAIRTPATFVVPEEQLPPPLTVVAYGDMRFTNPANVTATNPQARQALIAKIAEERPDAVFLNGDVPYVGGDPADYAEYHKESAPWRDAGLRVYPALGNHEFKQCEEKDCLENWWSEFPDLRDHRWYSVQLGPSFFAIALDSDTSLLPDSEQMQWLQDQLALLPRSVRFVLVWMHHPPVADPLGKDSPRDNEVALRDFLEGESGKLRARFVVVAAHIHNYERFQRGAVTYLVSGGGGAKPTPVERGPDDLFQDQTFPNFHYVKLVLEGGILRGTMYRLDPHSATPAWTAADRFEVHAQ